MQIYLQNKDFINLSLQKYSKNKYLLTYAEITWGY